MTETLPIEPEVWGPLHSALKIIFTEAEISMIKVCLAVLFLGIAYVEWRTWKKYRTQDQEILSVKAIQAQMQITVNGLSGIVESMKASVTKFISGLEEARETDRSFDMKLAEKAARQLNFEGLLQAIDRRTASIETRLDRLETHNKGQTT